MGMQKHSMNVSTAFARETFPLNKRPSEILKGPANI
jgi:hypothetical protein